MADLPLRHSLSGVVEAAGHREGAGLHVTDRRGLPLVHLFARKGRETALATALSLPREAGETTTSARYTAFPLARGQWLLLGNAREGPAFARALREKAGEQGYVSEQSASRTLLRVQGAATLALLARGCPLDLDAAAARVGMCAQTTIADIPALLRKVDAAPTFELLIPSSLARAFWDWLVETAAPFGASGTAEL